MRITACRYDNIIEITVNHNCMDITEYVLEIDDAQQLVKDLQRAIGKSSRSVIAIKYRRYLHTAWQFIKGQPSNLSFSHFDMKDSQVHIKYPNLNRHIWLLIMLVLYLVIRGN